MAEVSFVLRANGLSAVNSWQQAKDRIVGAVKDGKLPPRELVQLLRDSEEYGGQHVFFYATSKENAAKFTSQDFLRTKLLSLDRLDLLEEPNFLSKPGSRGFADARLDREKGGLVLILKSVESRVYYRLENEYEENAGLYKIRRYRRFEFRAVDLIRVHSDGFTELCIASADSASDYSDRVTSAWSFFGSILSQFQFERVSVGKAQQKLWKDRKNIANLLRYSDSRLRDAKGTVLTAATGAQQDSLFEDPRATASIDAFWDDETVCDKSNMWWLKREDELVPSKNVHVLMAGASNEFAIPGKCNRADYEYVLAQIRKANG